MKFLVTGGCGFIGSHLSEALIADGHSVEVLDDLSTGKLENVGGLSGRPDFSVVIDTILNAPLVEELVRRNDFVFHLAAAVGVKRVLDNPVDSILINVEGTRNVLAACARHGKKTVLASTSEIYGKNENVPFAEGSDIIIGSTTKKRWSYACTKALDEFLALAYHEEKRLPVIIVRLFNTVGPRQSDMYGMVIPRFVKQALAGRPLTVFGDGKQSRCFVHVKDVIEGLRKLIVREEAYGEIFNIGSCREVSIKALAETVKAMAGSDSAITYISPEQVYQRGFEDMYRRIPDTTKIKSLIGFEPARTLEDIVGETVAYYREHQ